MQDPLCNILPAIDSAFCAECNGGEVWYIRGKTKLFKLLQQTWRSPPPSTWEQREHETLLTLLPMREKILHLSDEAGQGQNARAIRQGGDQHAAADAFPGQSSLEHLREDGVLRAVDRVGPTKNPKYFACPAKVRSAHKRAAPATAVRTCSCDRSEGGTMMDLARCSFRQSAKSYSLKI